MVHWCDDPLCRRPSGNACCEERRSSSAVFFHGFETTQEWLDEGVLALKQYYAVALLDPFNRHAVSDAIDPFWHAHILHTKQYAEFCDNVFHHYVHHIPLDHADTQAVGLMRKLYDYTYQVYEDMFGYVNPEFFASQLEDERLVCMHGADDNAEMRRVTKYPAVPALAA